MRFHVSEEFVIVENIINSMIWHREHCHGPCNVMLYMLKRAAEQLLDSVANPDEHAELVKRISLTKWI